MTWALFVFFKMGFILHQLAINSNDQLANLHKIFKRSKKGIVLSQRIYTLYLFKETCMSSYKPIDTPIDSNQKLGDDKKGNVDTSKCQRLVGQLIYLSRTRPNIVSDCHKSIQAFTLSRTPEGSISDLEIHEEGMANTIKAYTNADWVGSITDSRSITGYCMSFVWDNLVIKAKNKERGEVLKQNIKLWKSTHQ
ncbi:putative mitochondrial protein, partial [Mucuna pruriens]